LVLLEKLTIEDIDLRGKRVLIRTDFNVPLGSGGEIEDDFRIRCALPTIQYCLSHDGIPILMSHLGRPKGKVVEKMKLGAVAKRLSELLGRPVKKLDNCVGHDVRRAIANLSKGDVVLLENLRFHPGEEENSASFSRELAVLGDIYVNDAFSASHRRHASMVGVPRLFSQAVVGLLLRREIEHLSKVIVSPEHPFVAIVGGSKISTKVPLIKSLLQKVDKLIVGGGMAYTFLRALGAPVGESLVEEDMVNVAKDILIMGIAQHIPILYPIDHVVVSVSSDDDGVRVVHQNGISDGFRAVDIGPLTIAKFVDTIKDAKTILWNGPLGICEIEKFATGTNVIARTLAGSSGTTIVGGGDSAAFFVKTGLLDRVTHVSTGGAACLEFLSGKELPGISILADR
jgi:phosphoglycerate kinase